MLQNSPGTLPNRIPYKPQPNKISIIGGKNIHVSKSTDRLKLCRAGKGRIKILERESHL